MPAEAPMLQIEKLSVEFGEAARPVRAVHEVSFTLGRERLGIVGESGSGKSTAGRAIMRLQPKGARVRADALRFMDRDLLSLSEREMTRIRGGDMALILQDPRYSLNPVKPIGTQIAESARVHLKLGSRAARQAALEMLGHVRIRDPERMMTLYPHEISGGMGQRAMIAMMLLNKPKLVIADEPTSALDVSVRQDVLTLLDRLVRENGSGLILISHDIRMVARFCDRILVMYAGRVVEELRSLDEAEHPYTRGLIASMPGFDGPRPHRLPVIDRARLAALEEAAR
ncbi:ABC transporter ATP-binding protein [Inquilinus limosus]|uniref:ABC transporter ATP-binding protein n=1 Tax=Inquilinus limosus TaxID=171674 RepID=UPI00047ACC9A|nr:ABC transporter ATP-binding protein [Inquilinus limosus]